MSSTPSSSPDAHPHAAAEAAALAMMQLAAASGACAHFAEVYGAGVMYRAFTTHADVVAFVGEPSIGNDTTYLTGERAGMCGELAVGAMALQRADNTIVVVDDVERSTRTTVSRIGSLAGRPLTIEMELVPCEIEVEQVPQPLDDEQRRVHSQRVVAAARAYRDAHADATERALYFIDGRLDEGAAAAAAAAEPTDAVQRIAQAEFEQALADMTGGGDDGDDDGAHSDDGEVPVSMQQLATLLREYDTQRQAVVWLRHSDMTHDAWTVNLDDDDE